MAITCKCIDWPVFVLTHTFDIVKWCYKEEEVVDNSCREVIYI